VGFIPNLVIGLKGVPSQSMMAEVMSLQFTVLLSQTGASSPLLVRKVLTNLNWCLCSFDFIPSKMIPLHSTLDSQFNIQRYLTDDENAFSLTESGSSLMSLLKLMIVL